MEPFVQHTGVAVPLKRANVDTDQICAGKFLKRITKTGYDDALFAAWREDPDFVLNQERFTGASVLVVGPSFGTGSSREHAVWALRDYGFNVIIGSSFADIFSGNSGKQGLLLATITQDEVEEIWELIDQPEAVNVSVDLEAQVIAVGDRTYSFTIDPHTRYRLLNGLDEISLTLQYEDDIRAYEENRPSWKPRITV